VHPGVGHLFPSEMQYIKVTIMAVIRSECISFKLILFIILLGELSSFVPRLKQKNKRWDFFSVLAITKGADCAEWVDKKH